MDTHIRRSLARIVAILILLLLMVVVYEARPDLRGQLEGALVALLTTLVVSAYVESARMPNLTIHTAIPRDDPPYTDAPARYARFLSVAVGNQLPKWWVQWFINREAATRCRGVIEFLKSGGEPLDAAGQMVARWSDAPQPVVPYFKLCRRKILIMDFRESPTQTMDIYPGEVKLLNVAGRFDDEEDGYGWNDESYGNNWRNPRWKLPQGEY